MPQPSALMIVRISSWPSILTRLAFSTFSILPRSAQDRLDVGVAALLGGAAGGITFDEEHLGVLVALAAAIGQLAGQAVAFQAVLAAGQLARLARRLARLGGEHALLEDRLGFLRVLLENTLPSCSFTAELTKPSTSTVAAACPSSGLQTAARGSSR